jgi:hypothetical protein
VGLVLTHKRSSALNAEVQNLLEEHPPLLQQAPVKFPGCLMSQLKRDAKVVADPLWACLSPLWDLNGIKSVSNVEGVTKPFLNHDLL